MKNIFLVFMALITTSVNAQTKVISFKSHSGDMNNFIFKETGNFGLDERIFSPSFNPDTIVRISDSMYVFINGQGKDTINNIPGLIPEEHDLSLNDIKKRFPRTILIGFEENEKGVMMTDKVSYKIPFGFLGHIAQFLFVKRQLKGIFEYRVKVLEEMFGKG